ncbi:MAG: site-2 protease family protein [Candidatus Hydrogenedentes bacterium]|nr:site-2 protease family protein [Candidatus Hydrogenedentota bacterium]
MEPEIIAAFIMQYFCLVFSLSVHEASHAKVAEMCGDPTARLLGRVTLNPAKHVDPIGTVIMPMMMFFTRIPFLFGWAKPVPYNPRNLKNLRRDPVLIALAGPASNLLIAIVTILLLRIGFIAVGIETMQDVFLLQLGMLMIYINLLLALFNMIPVPPLDGSALLGFLLPDSGKQMLESIGPFGILIAIFISSRFLSGPLDYLFEQATWLALWGIQQG